MILEYNAQRKAAILDSNSTLESLVTSVVERARSELNIYLLERHSINEWLDVYYRSLHDNPISINGTNYIVRYDAELGVSYLTELVSFQTFTYGFQEMNNADATLNYWASYRPLF